MTTIAERLKHKAITKPQFCPKSLMQNSWGDCWGQRGYFWMPFGVIKAPDTDLWMVHTGGPWK